MKFQNRVQDYEWTICSDSLRFVTCPGLAHKTKGGKPLMLQSKEHDLDHVLHSHNSKWLLFATHKKTNWLTYWLKWAPWDARMTDLFFIFGGEGNLWGQSDSGISFREPPEFWLIKHGKPWGECFWINWMPGLALGSPGVQLLNNS